MQVSISSSSCYEKGVRCWYWSCSNAFLACFGDISKCSPISFQLNWIFFLLWLMKLLYDTIASVIDEKFWLKCASNLYNIMFSSVLMIDLLCYYSYLDSLSVHSISADEFLFVENTLSVLTEGLISLLFYFS